MIRARTLFVVGAGASTEVNLPAGEGIKQDISNRTAIYFDDFPGRQVKGDKLITEALNTLLSSLGRVGEIDAFVEASFRISQAMPQAPSIDHFIHSHAGNERIEWCGKLAIVRSIIEAERKSKLYFEDRRVDSTIHFDRIEETWYSSLMKMLVNGLHVDDVHQIFDNISFITFNYDRCIEHFFYHAIQNYYGIPKEQAAEILENLTLIHPYGQIGNLPWQGGGSIAPYGGDIKARPLVEISEQIKTFTEKYEDASEMNKIRAAVEGAETVIFLGFAFHEQNMQLIQPRKDNKIAKVIGTCFRMPSSEVEITENQVRRFAVHGRKIRFSPFLKDTTCYNLFNDYWRTISY